MKIPQVHTEILLPNGNVKFAGIETPGKHRADRKRKSDLKKQQAKQMRKRK